MPAHRVYHVEREFVVLAQHQRRLDEWDKLGISAKQAPARQKHLLCVLPPWSKCGLEEIAVANLAHDVCPRTVIRYVQTEIALKVQLFRSCGRSVVLVDGIRFRVGKQSRQAQQEADWNSHSTKYNRFAQFGQTYQQFHA